jgi:hypothetical protein
MAASAADRMDLADMAMVMVATATVAASARSAEMR